LNETEGDAAGRDAAALWWGEKSERLAVFNGGRGERRARGGEGAGRGEMKRKVGWVWVGRHGGRNYTTILVR